MSDSLSFSCVKTYINIKAHKTYGNNEVKVVVKGCNVFAIILTFPTHKLHRQRIKAILTIKLRRLSFNFVMVAT